MRRSTLIGTALAVALSILAASLAVAGSGEVQQAKRATARFNSVVQAQSAGYGPFPAGVPLHECIMALDASGGMGFHWLNPSLLDDELDPAQPEVLVYAPRDDGSLDLVALEYVIFDSAVPAGTTPTIFGQELTFVPDGNRYEIPAFWQRHIWLYDRNDAGLFADFNPDVTC
ncbi:MAG TPA: hypothetical protein VFN76_00940 [Candidatus Limnocylindria bacterium]|nr:hypothetical protein [Candidatus Limnocylindria bacterium]